MIDRVDRRHGTSKPWVTQVDRQLGNHLHRNGGAPMLVKERPTQEVPGEGHSHQIPFLASRTRLCLRLPVESERPLLLHDSERHTVAEPTPFFAAALSAFFVKTSRPCAWPEQRNFPGEQVTERRRLVAEATSLGTMQLAVVLRLDAGVRAAQSTFRAVLVSVLSRLQSALSHWQSVPQTGRTAKGLLQPSGKNAANPK